jgi:CRISPR/Cas system CSM-associated protein Csm3 (group 7 of RAMP superfamily)
MEVRITLIITSETALSVGAGGSAGAIADKAIIRDGWGRPIIPGSQIKGRARHHAEAIVAALGLPGQPHFDDDAAPENLIRAIFGSPRQASPLRFVDLAAFSGERAELDTPAALAWQRLGALRPSVALNRRRGTAEDARLLLQETAPEGLQYSSYPHASISGRLPDLAHLALLWAALRLSTRWGGAKSRGLGWSQVAMQIEADGQPVDPPLLSAALHELERRAC